MVSEKSEHKKLLYNEGITMSKYPDLKGYILRFKRSCRIGEVNCADDQIHFFLKGLTPALNAACRLQPLTLLEWSSLDKLTEYVTA